MGGPEKGPKSPKRARKPEKHPNDNALLPGRLEDLEASTSRTGGQVSSSSMVRLGFSECAYCPFCPDTSNRQGKASLFTLVSCSTATSTPPLAWASPWERVASDLLTQNGRSRLRSLRTDRRRLSSDHCRE